MSHLKNVLSAFAFSCLLLTACKKDLKTASETAVQKGQVQRGATTVDGAGNARTLNATSPLLKRNGTEEIYSYLLNQSLEDVIPTPCNSNTPVRAWLRQQRSDWTAQMTNDALYYWMRFIPLDYAYYYENSSANQTFGSQGEYNQIMAKTFKDLNRFWNIESAGIVLVGGHGTILTDKVKVAKTWVAYGYSPQDADYFANIIYNLVTTVPQYRQGNHPYFSFNAYAETSLDLTSIGLGVNPPKIVMGDGILEGYKAIGYDDVAPQAILGHEYGHQVQFKLGFATGTTFTPAEIRRIELMADAFSAYFLSHARGAAMQWKRVQQFLQVFFDIGDCNFTSTGHHGTPTQRMASANWAYNLANDAQNQGKILTVEEFVVLFDAQLPTLVLQ